MALIVILSVYNGFDGFIRSRCESFQPDFVVTPLTGKTLRSDAGAFGRIRALPQVEAVCPVIEETAAVRYEDSHAITLIKGIDSTFERLGRWEGFLTEGEFVRYRGEIPHAVIGRTLARELRLHVRFLSPLILYYPDRKKEISLINPAASLRTQRLFPSGIVEMEPESDKNLIFVPLETAAELLGYAPAEATAVEIYLRPESSSARAAARTEKQIRALTDGQYSVKNRYMQNETLYKMMRSEKFAVYLILFFIIIIISVNVFGSLSLLILEKQADLETYRSLGASERMLRSIFIWQGWLISLCGAAAGILLGLGLSFLQQRFGLISIPGNYLVSAYPVIIRWSDVLITFAGVAVTGYLIARIPVSVLK